MYFIVYQLTNIFPVQEFFEKKDFVPDRSTWLKAISDLLPQQMIKSQLALAAILHEYEPANLPGIVFTLAHRVIKSETLRQARCRQQNLITQPHV
ncbi:hypothetical protein COOONC_27289 [Cooperia oncophora]